MHPNAALIERFYAAFAARDAAGMQACYHPEIVFRDPAFGELRGPRADAMWAMLTSRATDLDIRVSGIEAGDRTGRAHWNARYTFTQTGRAVLNEIDAVFEFRDGLIIRHTDTFSFWRWVQQALGPVGLLLGWAPPLRRKVSATANRGLDKYIRDTAPPSGATTVA
ncbi:MAG TPA: nuclear transport factor 2 family protein [Longimicrobium sp.]|jgi:ketosteroid isomerase-like protein|uniref:nuclear transport factor 2 family protein n=1 Tax=Longimicrobium sp. TaxID=2029185 RepID=UPI002ED775EA